LKESKSLNPVYIQALAVPVAMVVVMWAVHLLNAELHLNLTQFGLKPRTMSGIFGIFTMPFLHGSYAHLLNNTGPVLVLGWALYKFYPTLATRSLISIWVISGIWLWISGRPSFHVGASGIVYGLAAFLFLSGWLRLEKRVAALSLLVAFVYGSLWWGVLPVDPTISWEGHFWGALAGFAMAVYFRKKGPQKPIYQWELEDEVEMQIVEQHETTPGLLSQETPPEQENRDSNAPVSHTSGVNIKVVYAPSKPPLHDGTSEKR
jgi:membrane associated rhomboid family serine protease